MQRTKQDFVDLEVVKTYPVRVSRGLPVSQEVLERYGVRSSIDEQTGEVNAVYYPYHDQDKNVVGYKVRRLDRKSTRLNSSHSGESRMPSSA